MYAIRVLAALLMLSLVSCATPSDKTDEGRRTLMRTDERHELARRGDGYAGIIPYSYTNRTGAPVYLVNCNGDVSPAMQRLVGGAWENWWIPATNACLSPPVVIPPGATYDDTLHVVLTPAEQQFFTELIAGGDTTEFRLVWHQALGSFDADARPFGAPIPLENRVSNSFRLRPR